MTFPFLYGLSFFEASWTSCFFSLMAPSQTPQQTRHCIRYFMETPFVSLILDSSVSDVIRWCLTVRAEDVADWVADPVAPSPLPPRVHLRGPLRPVLSPPSAVDELCAPRHLNHSGGVSRLAVVLVPLFPWPSQAVSRAWWLTILLSKICESVAYKVGFYVAVYLMHTCNAGLCPVILFMV